MEVKIKDQDKLIDATIEVVDGVMIVSPKEEKVDVTKFKDGDVISCGWVDDKRSFSWTCILRGEIEYIFNNMLICDYCSLDCNGEFLDHNSGSDSATWVRYATEKEKKKFFDKLAEEGYTWDSEKRELVKTKWKPKYCDFVYVITASLNSVDIFTTNRVTFCKALENAYKYNRVFRTEEECKEFCNRLNKAILQVKP